MKAFFLLLFLSLVTVFSGVAQKAAPSKNYASYNLQQQFSSLKYRSSTQIKYNQEYKVVKQSSLEAFFKNVQDTLRAREQSIKNAGKETAIALAKTQKELADQKALVKSLQQENSNKAQQIQESESNVSNLSVLGIGMNKSLYVGLSLAVIVGLLVFTGICAYLYKKSNAVTQEKIDAYDEISEEFKAHKQSAREKEMKLKRDQQSEANKVEDLKQQIAQLQKRVSM